ncbi:hypothetical protein ACFXO9_20915 [Nocardia tengchongensis]|uniref:hypothetical protein n=1 Tax=Nocardia tengchongensis TaxID=2055889 RepID=UPI0036BEDBE7
MTADKTFRYRSPGLTIDRLRVELHVDPQFLRRRVVGQAMPALPTARSRAGPTARPYLDGTLTRPARHR